MPKILVGCLVIVLLLVVGGAGTAWFMFIKPAADYATEFTRMGQEFTELERSIRQTGPYQPPADGQMTEDQLERLLAAQRQMRAGMTGELERLEARFEEMQAQVDDEDRDLRLREIAEAYRELGGLLLEGKRNQVRALNDNGFSMHEYAWVRHQAYLALGEQVAVAAFGDQPAVNYQRRVSDQVIAMVEPHREELLENHVLAWFGL